MKLSEIGELLFLEIIRNRFRHKSKDIIVGIGDDAAVTRPKNKNLLLTTDMMVEGIHFDLKFMTPYQLGFKLVSVNVSDIYAMGGIPQYLLLDIAVNKNTEKSFVDRFFAGLRDSMKLYKVSLIGGDMCSSKKDMVISASLTGYANRPIRRSGAKVGDKIYVTGNLGDSACGLELLKRLTPKSTQMVKNFMRHGETENRRHGEKGKKSLRLHVSASPRLSIRWEYAEPLFKRHLMPEARNPKSFTRHATAMIDISDGLFIDLSRLCNESKVGAVIYEELIPVSSQMKRVSSTLRLNIMKLATSGGEDYELLFTAPYDLVSSKQYEVSRKKNKGQKVHTAHCILPTKITCIGEVIEKDRVVVDKIGREFPMNVEGYQHFVVEQ